MCHIFDSALIILDFIQGLFLTALDVLSWDKTLITLFGIRSQISLNTYKLCLVCVISIDGLTAIITQFFLISFSKQFQFWGCLAFVPMYHLEWLSPFYKWGSWSPVSWSNFLQIIASRRWKWYSNSGLFGPKLIVFPLFHSGFLY